MKEEHGIPRLPTNQSRLCSNRFEKVLDPRANYRHAWTAVCVLLFAHREILPQGMAAHALLGR